MSFILDALKKSEAERQRQSVPGLMDARLAPRRSGLPVWAIIVGVLLAINVVVLAVVLLRRPAVQQPARAADAAKVPHTAAPASSAEPGHFSPLDSAPVYAPEIPVDEPAGAGKDTATVAAGVRRPRADPSLAAANAPAADAGSQNDEVLPEIGELNLTGEQTLPELHLDVHVYATSAAERFVYINMRKYREGSVIADGLTIERIRRDGVVMNFQGLRFLLPRK